MQGIFGAVALKAMLDTGKHCPGNYNPQDALQIISYYLGLGVGNGNVLKCLLSMKANNDLDVHNTELKTQGQTLAFSRALRLQVLNLYCSDYLQINTKRAPHLIG